MLADVWLRQNGLECDAQSDAIDALIDRGVVGTSDAPHDAPGTKDRP